MATVTFDKATRVYPGADKPAVDQLDLEIGDGEFLVLVGPSGCGKSTSLRMLAGLEDVNAGRILIGDRDVTQLPPKDRDIAMVFQNYALYPHMSVADNMGFALKIAGIDKDEIRQRVEEAAKILDLEPYLDRKPKALSGGQRQRVAMGRAIVRNPQVFLMDEPLSNLDAKLRVQTRTQIASLQRRLGVTTVYVTHDQVEAMTMGDRVVRAQGRPAPAGRHAARAVRPPEQRLRRRLHRLARHEPARAAGRPTAASSSATPSSPSSARVLVQASGNRSRSACGRRTWSRPSGACRAGRRGRGARRRRLHLRPRPMRRRGAPGRPRHGGDLQIIVRPTAAVRRRRADGALRTQAGPRAPVRHHAARLRFGWHPVRRRSRSTPAGDRDRHVLGRHA